MTDIIFIYRNLYTLILFCRLHYRLPGERVDVLWRRIWWGSRQMWRNVTKVEKA